MNLEILLCLCFVCEIVLGLGYWTRPGTTKPYLWTRPGIQPSQWVRDLELDRRRLSGVSQIYNNSHTQSLPIGKDDIRMRGRHIKSAKKKSAREDDGQKYYYLSLPKLPRPIVKYDSLRQLNESEQPIINNNNQNFDVLRSGVLDPYSIKRQLQQILEDTMQDTPINASLEVIGHTAEYNDLILIKMSSNTNISSQNEEEEEYVRRKNIKYEENVAKKLIFIVHNLNPIGAENLRFLRDIGAFTTLLDMYIEELKRFDIFLMPLANPDGFSVNTPFWYKNVSPQEGGFGVNLDNNFDVAWKGTVENTLSQFYQGPTAFSEAETRAIRDIFFRYNHNMVAYINIHASSYGPEIYKGDAILYPKGYSETTSNDDKYMDLRGDIDEVLRNASLHLYSMTVDTLYSWYGKVTGKSVDYASSIYGIPFSLEICMQSYDNEDKQISDLILNEVWGRIFKVIFNNIEKSLHKEDHMRRYKDNLNK